MSRPLSNNLHQNKKLTKINSLLRSALTLPGKLPTPDQCLLPCFTDAEQFATDSSFFGRLHFLAHKPLAPVKSSSTQYPSQLSIYEKTCAESYSTLRTQNKILTRKLLDELQPAVGTIYHPSISTISSLLYCPADMDKACPSSCPLDCSKPVREIPRRAKDFMSDDKPDYAPQPRPQRVLMPCPLGEEPCPAHCPLSCGIKRAPPPVTYQEDFDQADQGEPRKRKELRASAPCPRGKAPCLSQCPLPCPPDPTGIPCPSGRITCNSGPAENQGDSYKCPYDKRLCPRNPPLPPPSPNIRPSCPSGRRPCQGPDKRYVGKSGTGSPESITGGGGAPLCPLDKQKCAIRRPGKSRRLTCPSGRTPCQGIGSPPSQRPGYGYGTNTQDMKPTCPFDKLGCRTRSVGSRVQQIIIPHGIPSLHNVYHSQRFIPRFSYEQHGYLFQHERNNRDKSPVMSDILEKMYPNVEGGLRKQRKKTSITCQAPCDSRESTLPRRVTRKRPLHSKQRFVSVSQWNTSKYEVCARVALKPRFRDCPVQTNKPQTCECNVSTVSVNL